MIHVPSSFYAEWRRRNGVLPMLREDPERPAERLLQAVWYHQRLRREDLVTSDGRPVQVLHPGFWNREAGPDFRKAILKFGQEPPSSGDVEVDLSPSGWHSHGHDRNPAFRNVILHAVWEHEGPAGRPTLALRPILDAPVDELSLWLSSEASDGFPTSLAGSCSAPLGEVSSSQLMELLRQAALVRLQSKAAQIQARARHSGWEQALWEALLRGLGYKHNVWPMQRLAELRSLLCPPRARPSVPVLQARLLGVAGLLPVDLPRARGANSDYPRRLWDCWWRERDAFSDFVLPRSIWRLSGTRPPNHPERRLALAAHWLCAGDSCSRLERWCESVSSGTAAAGTLLDVLQICTDAFWSWHWTLRSPRLARPQPLLGAARTTDLAVNAILPWLWIRAAEGKNTALQRDIEQRFLDWPAGEDNAVLRLARKRVLGRSPVRCLRGAAAQQGLLQIVRDFCEHADSLCANCRFPALLEEWRRVRAA